MATCCSLVRREVPKDNSCLFVSLGTLCELSSVGDNDSDRRAISKTLRETCAKDVVSDPDPATRELILGMPVSEYSTWISNETHWGGESEVLILGRYYNVEVAIASCESLSVLVYGADGMGGPPPAARVYLLYTGQHYDPIFGRGSHGEEICKLPAGENPQHEAMAIALARAHNAEAARLAKQKRVKKLKCGGCGALVEDAEAFQAHCAEVEHDDDFAYDCETVEVVIEAGDALPDGNLDLADTGNVHCFNNANVADALSTLYPAHIQMSSVRYKSLEHFWRAAPFLSSAPDTAREVAEASTAEQARVISLAADSDLQKPGWDKERESVLLSAVRAKFVQNVTLQAHLSATGIKTIVNVDPDPWMGMQAQGGISTGRNHLGKALSIVRDEIRATPDTAPSMEGNSPTGKGVSSWWCCAASVKS